MFVNSLIQVDENIVRVDASYQTFLAAAQQTSCAFITVVDSTGYFIGLIKKSLVLNESEESFSAEESLENHFIYDYFHIVETIREFLKVELLHLPVIDEEGFYLGLCALQDVQFHFNRQIGLIEGGSLIVLRTSIHNYSLVDVAKIVESNQAKVLNFYVTSHPDADVIEITVVLNISEISDITSAFNRFEYDVVYSSTTTEQNDFLKERYDSLMHYLDI